MKFTLKVLRNKKNGCLHSDSKHYNGGIDIVQIKAFEHLFPDGGTESLYEEVLFNLAELHGWTVEVRNVQLDPWTEEVIGE